MFKFLKLKLFKIGKGLLAFDFGSYSIKVAEFKIVKGEPILTGFVQGRTFENVLFNGIINDEKLLATNVKNILWNLSSVFDSVVLALPYELIIYGKIVTKEIENEDNIRDRINEEIPYKIEDVYYSYYTIPSQNGYEVYFIVVKKDVIDKYKDFFKSNGYKLENIDADFINLHNYSEFLYGESNRLIIDWGYSKIKLLFSTKHVPIYGRELFSLGLKALKQRIVKELKILPEVAEKIMVNFKNEERKEEIKKIYKEYIKEVLKEIKYSIDIISQKFNINIEVIYIVGGGARIPNIKEILKDYFDIETKNLRIEDKFKVSKDIDPDYLDIINTQGANAIAIGVKDFI